MRTRVELLYRFESAHFLPHVASGHPCGTMHGHSYRMTAAFEGEIDPAKGWITDFGDLDVKIAPIIKQLDHQTLNTIAGLENPTSEVLAAWLWGRIRPLVPELVEIAVAETERSRCIYHGQ